jgi:cbb3-type cytochrome oxidase maturation protein
MSVIYIMIPLALVLAGAALAAFIWSIRKGQLDDLDTPPTRVLFDDEDL